MKRTILLLALAAALPAYGGETWGPYHARVLDVTDGDTVRVEVSIWPGLNWTGRLRLAGIDTPELRGSPVCERQLAQAAAAFTRAFLEGTEVILVKGVTLGKYGGRVVGTLTADGRDLAAALLAAGHARVYPNRAGPWCK